MGNRWLGSSSRRSAEEYDLCWTASSQAGLDVHGEAGFVASLGPSSVLDAGCGTGRVAIELALRGVEVVGVDLDPEMLAGATGKAPHLRWLQADLAEVEVLDATGQRQLFDVVVLAGNVMIFLEPGTEGAVVANLARHLAPGGALVAGFQLDSQLDLATYDRVCKEAGLVLAERWSTWERGRWQEGGRYAVSTSRWP